MLLLRHRNLAADQKWGTVKGKVVFDGTPPERAVINVAGINPACCDVKTPVLSDELVVDAKTKGVRYAMAWLIAADGNSKTALPIHPTLAKPAAKVVIDQPCYMFEPHVLGIRTGQTLVFKNSAMCTHNVSCLGGGDNPEFNKAVAKSNELEIEGWKPYHRMISVSCTIHGWMKAWVHVFDHPYFAVTNEKGEFEIKNAPAGKYRLVVWQEKVGWVAGEKGKDPTGTGIPLEIKADGPTDVGDIKLTVAPPSK